LVKEERFDKKNKKFDSSDSDSESYKKPFSARKNDFQRNSSNQISQYRSNSKYKNDSDEEPNSYRKKENKLNEKPIFRKKYSDDDDDDDDDNFRNNRFEKKLHNRNKMSENNNLNDSSISSINASKGNKSDTNDKNKEKEKVSYLELPFYV
jgi:hypothetical protein